MTTATQTKEITNMEDVIDVRDVIARVEELETYPTLDDDSACYSCGTYLKTGDEMHESDCEILELQRLTALLDDLRGNGGDEEWRDAWYPITLIRDSHFQDYAQELAEDIGAVNTDANWPNTCIDWARAARELQTDYSPVKFNDVTYWYR